ncbi:MAG: hypothetical protein AB3N33_12120 [Puniceicoccaceae bacterium]
MASRKDRPDVTLEALLKLKRNERPGGEFWDSFEQDFQRRRLHALVEKPAFSDFFWSPAMKTLAIGLPALMMVALAVVWTPGELATTKPSLAGNAAPALDTGSLQVTEVAAKPQTEVLKEMPTNLSSSQFVVDAIQDSSSSMNFRKVLYTPAIRLSAPSGAFYVRDNMSSSNYRVTTADAKLGRNF